jgi:hypothetical protein
MFEFADRELQSFHDEDMRLRNEARLSLQRGQLQDVEITPETLKAYLDKRLGSDARMSAWSYQWTTALVHRLGFANLQQIDDFTSIYEDDQWSRPAWGTRQGQLSRIELQLLAAMGENFIIRHTWAKESSFPRSRRRLLDTLRKLGSRLETECLGAGLSRAPPARSAEQRTIIRFHKPHP